MKGQADRQIQEEDEGKLTDKVQEEDEKAS